MLHRLLFKPTNHPFIQLIRYGFVAAIAFIFDFGLLYVFTAHFHLYYLISAALSFSIALVVNYLLSVRWVFRQQGSSKALEFTLFTAIGLVGLALNTGFIWLFTSIFGVYYLISKLIATAIVFFWSFFARRYLVFRRHTEADLERAA